MAKKPSKKPSKKTTRKRATPAKRKPAQTQAHATPFVEMYEDVAEVEGFAVVRDGVIDLRTVFATERGAMINWLVLEEKTVIGQGTGDARIKEEWQRHRGDAEMHRVRVVSEGAIDDDAREGVLPAGG